MAARFMSLLPIFEKKLVFKIRFASTYFSAPCHLAAPLVITAYTSTYKLCYDEVVIFGFVQLERAVYAKGNVELWLMDLLKQAQWSLHVVIREASVIVKDPSFDIKNFLNSSPAQVYPSFRFFS